MTSAASTIDHNQMDIYVLDTQELGQFVADELIIEIWEEEGLGTISLVPHLEFLPICIEDTTPEALFASCSVAPYPIPGNVTLVDMENEVIDCRDFMLEAGTVGALWSILHRQYQRDWRRWEVEEKTWGVRGEVSSGTRWTRTITVDNPTSKYG